MTRRAVSTSGAPAAIGPYSQGIVSDGFLFCSGQAALETRIREISHVRVRYGYRRVHVMLRREGWRHGQNMYDHQLLVPLIVHLPCRSRGRG